MAKYDFKTIEAKWRPRWDAAQLDKTPDPPKRKQYVLEMFAYPSGDIHMGHFRNYTIGDVVVRHRWMAGFDVLHPFGWDAFGQPAEGAAIKSGIQPRVWTLKNIETGDVTLKQMAISYDWDREFLTCLPDYYKWTQWLFLLLHKRGLAYRADALVNWCPKDQWVLADEQAAGGKCWRCDSDVEKKPMTSWYFRYSQYAERLLKDIGRLNEWPERIRTMQRNWIGRSEGAELDFTVDGEKFSVFTTRPDTVYGVTFMAIAPENSLATKLSKGTPQEKAVADYIKKSIMKSDIERGAAGEKDGVYIGRDATNPFDGSKVKLYVADYVLAGYGTGIVMGVPAHDQRDFEFSKKYGIAIKVVIGDDPCTERAFVEEGPMKNSGPFNGVPSGEGIRKVTEHAQSKGFGRFKVTYRLRDWLISRQRYWGCPVPMIHCGKCGAVPVPEKDLPVLLPETIDNVVPKGRSPLADSRDYMSVRCPTCGREAERDPDTMDTFMDSSFYLFRFCDPKNPREIWSKESVKRWLPVDLYIGGAEHACGHLMYFRFITKVLFDAGYLPVEEPVVRLFNHGMVQDEKGETMSKSRGNVVSPAEIFSRWGVDVCRLAMLFFAPSEDEIKWSEQGLVGAQRFMHRIWDFVHESEAGEASITTRRKLHQTIARVTESMEKTLHFNTAMSAIMGLLNVAEKKREVAEPIVQMLAPMAPFAAEELWESLGHQESVFKSTWPKFDAAAAAETEIEIVVQINGKLRGTFKAAPGTAEEKLKASALAHDAVVKALSGKPPRKVITVKDRLVNIVV